MPELLLFEVPPLEELLVGVPPDELLVGTPADELDEREEFEEELPEPPPPEELEERDEFEELEEPPEPLPEVLLEFEELPPEEFELPKKLLPEEDINAPYIQIARRPEKQPQPSANKERHLQDIPARPVPKIQTFYNES